MEQDQLKGAGEEGGEVDEVLARENGEPDMGNEETESANASAVERHLNEGEDSLVEDPRILIEVHVEMSEQERVVAIRERDPEKQVDIVEEEAGFSEKPSSSSDSASSSTGSSPHLRIPTGPSDGFLWDPVVDQPILDAASAGSCVDVEGDFHISPLGIARPFMIGTIVGCLGAALYQVFVFKPVYATVSGPFLVLLVYALGCAWNRCLGRDPESLFGLQEHAIASIIAISAARGNLAVQTFAVHRMYFEDETPDKIGVNWTTAILAIFATAGLGCGVSGLLDCYTTTCPDMVFPVNLPVLSLMNELHHVHSEKSTNSPPSRRKSPLKLFGYVFGAAFLYELLPAYIAPILTGINVFCLSAQNAPAKVKRTFTNLFGGASGNEGLGLLGIALDWQFIGTSIVELPLVYQVNMWIGYLLCYGAVMGSYYSDIWNTSKFPMIATVLFDYEGNAYDQRGLLDERLSIDPHSLNAIGLPYLASSSVWTSITANVAFGSLIAHMGLFVGLKGIWPFVYSKRGKGVEEKQTSPKSPPSWWYTILIFAAFFAGVTFVIRQHHILKQVSFLMALAVGVAAIPSSMAVYGYLGVDFVFQNITKIAGAVIAPHRPFIILYFSMWSNSLVSISLFATTQTRSGHQLKVPPKVTFFAVLWGLILGGMVNYAVMESIVENQAILLKNFISLNIWSGQLTQTMNSDAVTWALAKELYDMKGPYTMIPLGLLVGFLLTCTQWVFHKLYPAVHIFKGRVVMVPVIFMASSMMTYGNTSSVLSTVAIALVSQLWLARRHKRFFETSAAVVTAALDGGTQTMVFVLSLAVLGALGPYKPFYKWLGNNLGGNVDYCDPN